MKHLLVILFCFTYIIANSQNNEQPLLVKHGIKKKIIQGFEYSNDSLVKQSYMVDELDKFGNTVSFKTYDMSDSLVREYKYKFSDDGKTEYSVAYDDEGNLEYSFVTIKDDISHTIRKMQMDSKGDTLVEQLWIRDRNLNDSILYRVRNGKRILDQKWQYNDGSMLISRERYDVDGDLLFKESFTYQKSGNCIKRKNSNNKVISIKCIEGNKEIWKILRDREGYRSGIKLVSQKGGERIETKLENGLTEKIEYFSKKGKLLALIKYTYITN